MEQHIVKIGDNAPAATYGGAAGTLVFWGAHAGEICMVISTLVSVLGFALQLYLATRRIKRLEADSKANVKVTAAIGEAVRVVDSKVEAVTPPK